MYFDDVNVKNELFKQKNETGNSLLNQVSAILSTSVKKDEEVLYRLQNKPINTIIDSDIIAEEDQKNIFNLSQIKDVCLKYNLRFLDSSYFKPDFPYEAISKIKAFEQKYEVTIKQFKLVAPGEVFKLEDCNKDPLLFAQLAENRYYLIHQWGNDLKWYRAVLSYPFRSIFSFFTFLWLPALIIGFAIPFSWLQVDADLELNFRLYLTVFSFISLFFFSIFLGSTSHKNFSDLTWDSKYYNK